jgi:MFS family permease
LTEPEYKKDLDFVLHVTDALYSIRFWHHSIMLFNGLFFGVYMVSVYKDIGLNKGSIGDRELTIAGAVGSFVNGSSRILWASLYDKFGFRIIYMIILVIQLISAVSLYSARFNFVAYSILLWLAFLCEGGHFSLFPPSAVKLYGIEEGGKIFTISFFAVPLSSFLGFTLAHFIPGIDAKIVFYIGALMTLFNIILLMVFDEDEIKIEYKDFNGHVIDQQYSLH